MAPQTPLFSPITREVTGYRQTKTNNTRPLMYPEEILQMDNKQCLVLIRGQKPLKGLKIIPDELSSYKDLKYTRVSEYIPKWRELDEEIENEVSRFDVTPEEDMSEDTHDKTVASSEDENEENRRTVAAFAEKMKRQATVYTDDDFSETDASDIINN